MSCNKCARCCQEFSFELNGEELWLKKFVKLLEVMKLNSLLRIVKKVKIIIRCKYLDENNLCEIYEKRPKRCRDFLCKKARVADILLPVRSVLSGSRGNLKEFSIIRLGFIVHFPRLDPAPLLSCLSRGAGKI